MTQPERLILAAVETDYYLTPAATHEQAQVNALVTLSRIAASTGPKNLQRLIAENKLALIAGRPEPSFEIPQSRGLCEEHVAVPAWLIRQAFDFLITGEAEERRIASSLHRCLLGVDAGF